MKNIYLPQLVKVKRVKKETSDVKTFTLAPLRGARLRFIPGQFLEISVFGAGEAPFSISSSPTQKELQVSIKDVGSLTSALHNLRRGEVIGLRGPFGNGFPLKEIKGYNILFVGGGIGLAPLRSLINYILDKRKSFKRIIILYGAKNPDELVFKDELKDWKKRKDAEFLLTVDRGNSKWKGNVGVVTTLFEKIKVNPRKTLAFICGPPVMIPFVIKGLLKMGLKDERIFANLERYMKCGVGKCGHCNIGPKYTCLDGPVFSYKEIKGLPEEF
jgi:sulfite reductase subunit B